jgi:hypothetical protein
VLSYYGGASVIVLFSHSRTSLLSFFSLPRAPDSCYLNLGVVSIFPLVSTVLLASSSKMSDEILKWREGSYLHCMYNRDYKGPSHVPHWARSAFGKKGGGDDGDLAKRLENCSSPCKVWNR